MGHVRSLMVKENSLRTANHDSNHMGWLANRFGDEADACEANVQGMDIIDDTPASLTLSFFSSVVHINYAANFGGSNSGS